MSRAISRTLLAAGAAALLSTQAAIAAPVSMASAVDPMVALSALGSAQSRTALCAGTAAATAATAAATVQAPPAGCVLPITTPAPPPVVTSSVAPPPPGKALGVWPILLGLAAVVALAALLLSGDGDNDGDLVPISP